MDDLGPFEDPAMVRRLVGDGMVLFFAVTDGVISWVGRSSEKILGRSPESLIGSPALDHIHPDDHALVLDTMAESARNAEQRVLAVLRIARADGSWATLEFGGMDLRDADGRGVFLSWGRSHESAGLLMGLLGSLLTDTDLGALLGQVVRWFDSQVPFGTTIALARADDGTHGTATPIAIDLPAALGADLDLAMLARGPLAGALDTDAPSACAAADLDPSLAGPAVAAGLAAVWVVPVPGRVPGQPDGALVSWRRRPGPISATHRRHLDEASRLCQLAFDWARTHQGLVEAATTDPLTGLANRTQLRVRAEADTSPLAALLFCDLDDFKGLNDTLGHGAGDRALQGAAERMQSALGDDDLLVRLGGDEFAIWCPDLDDAADAHAIAERVITSLAQPFEVDGTPHVIGCSIGIELVDRRDDRFDFPAVLRRADAALYKAKAAGKHRWASNQV